MNKQMQINNQKYLTIFLSKGGLGEAILQTPFYRALKSDTPNSEIFVLIHKNNFKVFESNPFIDKIIVYSNFSDLIKKMINLYTTKFSTCYIFDKSWKSNYLARLCINATKYYGFNRRNWESIPLSFKIHYNASKHESEYYIDLLQCNHNHSLIPEVFPKESDYESLKKLFPETQANYIALLAGGANNPGVGDESFRRWPVEKYCELAKEFVKKKYKILVVGGPSDIELNTLIESACEGECINLTGKTSLLQSGIALSYASLIITNDSGLMHLSACFNQNILCLPSTSSPVSILPKVRNAHFIWVDKDTYNSNARVFGTFTISGDKKQLFLKRLTTEMVYNKAIEVLSALNIQNR